MSGRTTQRPKTPWSDGPGRCRLQLHFWNTVNLHAVLGSPNTFGGFGGGGFGSSGAASAGFGGSGGAGIGAAGFGGGPASGAGSAGSSISLPFTDIMRSEAVVVAVSVGQTLGFAALFGMWLAVAFGPTARRFRTRRETVPRALGAGTARKRDQPLVRVGHAGRSGTDVRLERAAAQFARLLRDGGRCSVRVQDIGDT
jgi:hypothetical protein